MASEKTPLVGRDGAAGPHRDLSLARDAYASHNADLSRKAHQAASASQAQNHEDGHQSEGDFIKSVVFGGLDGILTTFAIVSGATGGSLGVEAILILGWSSKLADALSMGLGDALSSRAELEFILKEREREYWEFDNYPEGEKEEMMELYKMRGMTESDAKLVIDLMADHRDFFVDVMMVEELGLQVPTGDENPWFEGFVTFCSFIFFGFFPLLGYCIFPFAFPHMSDHTLFVIACVFSGLTLFALGAVKSMFSVKTWYTSGFEMLIIGSAVCAVAYSIGALTSAVVGIDPDQIEMGSIKN
mmetsp:Transcript_960/g.2264  ORF Transcript_960/g.2264 Transcript_960/m.2264 type:complete len:301 (-) Transcript_960:654-1556(-)|eukprot:CAMPEP_0171495758 /NCGR_PEP_ID=MMETSP0958-20121227/6314_1 /TAXON_ID=87120 /ORGANISM="Aurantiochytrium limacinum, Strain ATCCMYA-1381" /LENGTH=300 /DNA_ID=CAMNT_0012029765 /DNA_START=135 /DNA_END=1037 /DNA_ORIENTATION=-